MTLSLRFAIGTHVGLLRSDNQDSAYAGQRLLAVADGMGGHAGGDIASAVAIGSLVTLDEDAPGPDLIAPLRTALDEANARIRDIVASDGALEGMGTTVTALLWAGSRLGLLHIGDSRCYLLRGDELTLITHDHTLVQTLVDEGRIAPEEASTHPQRSLILRALDGRDDVEPDVAVREAQAGDRYLLCSDGLSSVVSQDTLCETLSAAGEPQATVDRLIELALRGGGPDNITCIVADILDGDAGELSSAVVGAAAAIRTPDAPPDPATAAGRAALAAARPPTPTEPDAARDTSAAEEPPPRRKRRRLVLLLPLVVILVIGLGVLGTWLWVRSQWYVGNSAGQVAVFHGVNGDVAGIDLSRVEERSGVPVASLQPFEQRRLDDGITADGLSEARRLVGGFRQEACASPSPAPTTAPLPAARRVRASATPSASASPSPLPAYCRATP